MEALRSCHERDPEAQRWHFRSGCDGTASGEKSTPARGFKIWCSPFRRLVSVQTPSFLPWWDSLKCQGDLYKTTRPVLLCTSVSYMASANAGHQWLPGVVMNLRSGGGIMLLAVPQRQGLSVVPRAEQHPIRGTDWQCSGLNKLLVLFYLTSATKGGLSCLWTLNQWAEWWGGRTVLVSRPHRCRSCHKEALRICPGLQNKRAAEPGAHPPTSLTQARK